MSVQQCYPVPKCLYYKNQEQYLLQEPTPAKYLFMKFRLITHKPKEYLSDTDQELQLSFQGCNYFVLPLAIKVQYIPGNLHFVGTPAKFLSFLL
jgi:hypothetical protein